MQFQKAKENFKEGHPHFVTMSAGNYAKSFAAAASQMGIKATVLMPDTAPDSRVKKLRGQGTI